MVQVIEMFQPDLMAFGLSVSSKEALFKEVGKQLELLGYVNEAYLAGLNEREAVFPTGLRTQYLNIALPHGNPENVIRPFVYIARVTEPIKVKQMGDGQELFTGDFFFLGISDGRKQVGLLSALMELFMNEEFVTAYKNETNGEGVKALVDSYLKKGVEEDG